MKSSTIKQICIECNKSFYVSSKELNRGNGNFCSLSCVAKHFNKQRALNNTKTYKCYECNTLFTASSTTGAKYCSRKCKNRYNSRKRKRRYSISRITCEICGWNECSCDIHHIQSISSGGTNDPSNLVSLCPNHHRMADSNLITKDDLRKTISKRTIPSSIGI